MENSAEANSNVYSTMVSWGEASISGASAKETRGETQDTPNPPWVHVNDRNNR